MIEPIVSVGCVTYNQKKYIKQALDSFLNQVTTFPFEIIVHDDCSTDGTRELINEYAKKDSRIVRILQNENQYSKGVDIVKEYIYPRCKGKYIAFCEGDDYWCDNYKLQKQFDYMKSNPDYSGCYHNTIMLNALDGKETLLNETTDDVDLVMEDLIRFTGVKYHISSLFFRSEYKIRPKEYTIPGIGDYPRTIYMCTVGKVRYLNDVMSVHRVDVEGSWTSENTASNNAERQIRNYSNINQFLNTFNQLTNHQYDEAIKTTIDKNECIILQWQDNAKEILKSHKKYYSSLSVAGKAIIIFKAYLPKTFKLLNQIRHSLKKRKI